MRRNRRVNWLLGLTIIAAGAAFIGLGHRHASPNRNYRIGWEIDPPEQSRAAGGGPAGFVVDVVNEAARRRGIHLQWSFQDQGSEASLRQGKVDLWPLMTITPERQRVVHISAPYVESVQCLVVRGDHPAHQLSDLSQSKIGYTGVVVDRSTLKRLLPGARIVKKPPDSILQSLCGGDIDAMFAEQHALISALLAGAGCAGRPLRIVPADGSTLQLGVGSTFEAAGAADDLRDEIGRMATEGKLRTLLAKWGYLMGRGEESIRVLLAARKREAWLAGSVVAFALLLVLTGWQAYRATQESAKARKSSQDLIESERRFRSLFENVRLAALMVDLKGIITFCNDYLLTGTGWTREELIGRGLTDFIVPAERPAVAKIIEGLTGMPAYWTAELGVLAKDGKVRRFQTNGMVLSDSRGVPFGGAVLAVDTTEHHALQERYLHAQKMEGLGRLAGGVAHDFNNLLTVICGYSEMIYSELKEGDPLRANADQVCKAGARAAQLTHQLLAFSRKQVVQPQALDLNAVVSESTAMLKRIMGEQIELVANPNPALGAVMADAGQVHQILMNLAVNARDAMPNGGKLEIQTSNVDIDSRDVSSNPEAVAGPYVELAVADTGTGMDEETKKRIFEPFFTTKPQGAGTGLGLATVYGIVKQSQGWIGLKSELGVGTRFTIYFPRVETPQSGPAKATQVPRPVSPAWETILLVEDQEEVRRFATLVLSDRGYRIVSAASGQEALGVIANHPEKIDLLITDVVLPGMSGFELAERLAKLRPEMKTLFTSGYTADVDALKNILQSGLAYLSKPYAPDALAAKVRHVIESPVDGTPLPAIAG